MGFNWRLHMTTKEKGYGEDRVKSKSVRLGRDNPDLREKKNICVL